MRLDVRTGDQQTPWACGHKGSVWYADVHADIDDELVISNAKRIVDKVLPQRLSTFFGGHYYSFMTREYLLNLLLFFYQDHGLFPSGHVCIVDRWVWGGMRHRKQGKWLTNWAWRFMGRADTTVPGYWIYIPSLLSVLSEADESALAWRN